MATFLITVSTPVAGQTVVKISPSTQTVNSTQNFVVDVFVQSVSNLYGYQFNMTFTPSIISHSFTEQGPFLSNNYNDNTEFYNGVLAPGRLGWVAETRTQSGTVSGSGTLTQVEFTPNGVAGSSTIGLSEVLLSDYESASIPATVTGGSVTVVTCTDQDGDGYSSIGNPCFPLDCSDTPNGQDGIPGNADDGENIYPGAVDICGDGIDQDCSGNDVGCTCVDNDGDTHQALLCGGNDCNDYDNLVWNTISCNDPNTPNLPTSTCTTVNLCVLSCPVYPVNCGNGLDDEGTNACNGELDWDSQDWNIADPYNMAGKKGDSVCPVGMTACTSPATIGIGNSFTVSCTSTVAGVNSLLFEELNPSTSDCTAVGWDTLEPNKYVFTCSASAVGTHQFRCSVDTAKSYLSGTAKTCSVQVQATQTCREQGEDTCSPPDTCPPTGTTAGDVSASDTNSCCSQSCNDLNEGDITDDLKVNIFDLTFIGSRFGLDPLDGRWDEKADDCTEDDLIDILDLLCVADNFGKAY